MLKIEDVKAGDELECIDRDGFTQNETKEVNCIIANQENIIIESLSNTPIGKAVNICGSIGVGKINTIFEAELKYFKNKEQSQQYTFDDLIDVAVQACKDGVIYVLSINSTTFIDYRHDRVDGKNRRYLGVCGLTEKSKIKLISDEINFIKSLYKETFVIELEDDCKRIKQRAKITFLNGNSVVMDQPPVGDGIVRIWNDGRYDFTVLKGATVEQERGRDDRS